VTVSFGVEKTLLTLGLMVSTILDLETALIILAAYEGMGVGAGLILRRLVLDKSYALSHLRAM
jgi:hypothetical protein